MIASALLLTLMVFMPVCFLLMDQLKFLVAYKHSLVHLYGLHVLAFALVLFLNLFAAAFTFTRKFFLKDAGRKLTHLDRQIKTGQSHLSAEITNKFQE